MPTSGAEGSTRPAPHLVITDLSAGYDANPIVRDISAEVGIGEVVAIVGPNGAGKSTLLKAITGRLHSSRGTVRLGGDDITNLRGDELARKGIGFVPQSRDVFDTLTVQENLEMGGYLLRNADIPNRVDEVLSIFPTLAGMRRRVALQLSGGERKMLAIGRVLMSRPTTLILDEPTANLSAALSEVVLTEYVTRTAGAGTAVLLVEQKAAAALEISNWAYLMIGGSISLSGPARELLDRQDFREVFLGKGRRPADQASDR
jgi:branched-chain amino acid transport system ATP-binding protein